jgi:hypothetical protein
MPSYTWKNIILCIKLLLDLGCLLISEKTNILCIDNMVVPKFPGLLPDVTSSFSLSFFQLAVWHQKLITSCDLKNWRWSICCRIWCPSLACLKGILWLNSQFQQWDSLQLPLWCAVTCVVCPICCTRDLAHWLVLVVENICCMFLRSYHYEQRQIQILILQQTNMLIIFSKMVWIHMRESVLGRNRPVYIFIVFNN